jgi:hypothetical protein
MKNSCKPAKSRVHREGTDLLLIYRIFDGWAVLPRGTYALGVRGLSVHLKKNVVTFWIQI